MCAKVVEIGIVWVRVRARYGAHWLLVLTLQVDWLDRLVGSGAAVLNTSVRVFVIQGTAGWPLLDPFAFEAFSFFKSFDAYMNCAR
jgi:hypothetical protein